MLTDLPAVPVVVIHLYENDGVNGEARTICSGDPMPFIHDGMYPKTPRYLCPLCQYYSTRANGEKVTVNEKLEATLYVNLWNSRCGNCNKGADPFAETHEWASGYTESSHQAKTGERTPGCGATFTFIGSDYIGANIEEWSEKNRPDLPWTDKIGGM